MQTRLFKNCCSQHFSNYFSQVRLFWLSSSQFLSPSLPLSLSLSFSFSLSRYITGMHFAFIHLRRSHSHVVKQKICPYNERQREEKLFLPFRASHFLLISSSTIFCSCQSRGSRRLWIVSSEILSLFLERTFSSPSQNRTKEATQKNSACGHPSSSPADRRRDRKTDTEGKNIWQTLRVWMSICTCIFIHLHNVHSKEIPASATLLKSTCFDLIKCWLLMSPFLPSHKNTREKPRMVECFWLFLVPQSPRNFVQCSSLLHAIAVEETHFWRASQAGERSSKK